MKKLCLLFGAWFLVTLAAPAAHSAQWEKAPLFSLPAYQGESRSTVHLKEMLASDKPVILFFWTTWCPYCVKEMKDLESYQKRDNVKILAINAGERSRQVERAIKKFGLTELTVLLDETGEVTGSYGVAGVPTFVYIDDSGVIRFHGNSYPGEELAGMASGGT